MYRLGTGRKAPTYVLAEHLTDSVVQTYIAQFLHTHPGASQADAESNPAFSKEIAFDISRGEHFRKPAASITEARHRLRMRYEKSGRSGIEAARKSLRQRHPRHVYVEVDEMRKMLADYFARDGEERGRGDFHELCPQELARMERKPDRQVIGIYFTYFNEDGTPKPKPRHRLEWAQREAAKVYTEDEDGVPKISFDTLEAHPELRRVRNAS